MKELIIPFSSVILTEAAAADATESVIGRLYAIEYRPNDVDTDADLTVTCVGAGAVSKPLLTLANAGTSNVWLYPRDVEQAVSNGADLTATSGGDRECPLLQGVVHVAVASCGGTTIRTGTVIIYWEQL
jgi:hypothetical protein